MAAPSLIVSLSTIPSRAGTLQLTVDSLLAQTRPADLILVCRSDGARGAALGLGPRVDVWQGRDFGPGTKLLGALEYLGGSDALVVTVDDDVIYDEQLLEVLAEAHARCPDQALGFRGWVLGPGGAIAWPGDARLHRYVDVLEGWAGALYATRFFGPEVFSDVERCASCFWTDDVWISGHLAERGIRRRLIDTDKPALRFPRLSPAASVEALKDHPDKLERNRRCARAFRFREARRPVGAPRRLPGIRRDLGAR